MPIIVHQGSARIVAGGESTRIVAAPANRIVAQTGSTKIRPYVSRIIVAREGMPGAKGEPGDGAALLEVVSFEAITAGQAIRIRATSGKGSPALADAIGTADVFGFATNSVGPEATIEVTRDRITLADWTALAGSSSLVRGSRYFLSQTIPGGITNAPNLLLTGACVVVVGEAISTTTLAIRITDPIRL